MEIAKTDLYGIDGVGVRRFVRAGDMIPPGLDLEEGAETVSTPTTPLVEPPVDFSAMSPEELDSRIQAQGLEIKGTGKDGNVLKADKVAALQAAG